jgi:aminoglycoside 3'-phosphotransferase-2
VEGTAPAIPLPDPLADLAAYTWHAVNLGRSWAHVYRLTMPKEPTLFLKHVEATYAAELRDEAERLAWLQGKLPVPKVVQYLDAATGVYLVTEAIPGHDLTEFNQDSDVVKRQMTVELAWGLRRVHALDPAGCPFDHTPVRQLAWLESQLVEHGGTAPSDQLKAAYLLLNKLKAELPEADDLVFTHGDPCLPNILVEEDRLSGFIDLGSAGIGDRYRDLALARWSLGYNFGPGYDTLFFDAYGLPELDKAKLVFHQAVEQFRFDYVPSST